jgi:hypothetical protein
MTGGRSERHAAISIVIPAKRPCGGAAHLFDSAQSAGAAGPHIYSIPRKARVRRDPLIGASVGPGSRAIALARDDKFWMLVGFSGKCESGGLNASFFVMARKSGPPR